MYIGHFSTPGTLLNRVAPRRLLVVAPHTSVTDENSTVHAFLDQTAAQPDLQVQLVNSAPLTAYCASRPGLFERIATLGGGCRVCWQYVRNLRQADAVLLFANTALIFSWAWLLLWLARLWGKRFLLKPMGGDLDLRLAALGIEQQYELIQLLNQMDGVLSDTVQLQRALQQLEVTNACYVPEWCASSTTQPLAQTQAGATTPFRLLYLAPVRRDKGPYELLHALQQLAYHSQYQIVCDFYGPLLPEERVTFLAELLQTPQARYMGVTEPEHALNLMSHYDALVLPTYCTREGHPGVILDAMTAGLPVISTDHRAIPELVEQGVTGLLAPVQDSLALKEAIIQLAQNPPLRQRMGAAGYNRSQTFRVDYIVPQLLRLIFPDR